MRRLPVIVLAAIVIEPLANPHRIDRPRRTRPSSRALVRGAKRSCPESVGRPENVVVATIQRDDPTVTVISLEKGDNHDGHRLHSRNRLVRPLHRSRRRGSRARLTNLVRPAASPALTGGRRTRRRAYRSHRLGRRRTRGQKIIDDARAVGAGGAADTGEAGEDDRADELCRYGIRVTVGEEGAGLGGGE